METAERQTGVAPIPTVTGPSLQPEGIDASIKLQTADVVTPILKLYQGVPLVLGLCLFVKAQPATPKFLYQYDAWLLTANLCYESIVGVSHNRLLESTCFGTVSAFAMPAYCLPQLHSGRSVLIFFGYHLVFSSVMVKFDINLMAAYTCNCMCLVVVRHVMVALVDAAQSVEKDMILNRNALQNTLAAREEIQRQFRELLEVAFDGIVQVVDGRVHWSNNKFKAMFPMIQNHDQLRLAFAESDQGQVDELTRACPEMVHKRERRLLVARDPDGWEFDCELVDATSQADSTIVIGVRIVGEKRQVQAPGLSDALAVQCHPEPSSERRAARSVTIESRGSLSLTASVKSRSSPKSVSSASRRSRWHKLLRRSRRDACTQTEITRPPRLPSTTSSDPQAERAVADRLLCQFMRPRRSPNVKRSWGQVTCSNRLLLPQFQETPNSTIWMCLLSMLSHLNVSGSGCCTLHISLSRLRDAMKELANRCQPGFLPNRDLQCVSCLAMCEAEDQFDNFNDANECMVCGGTDMRPPRNSREASDNSCGTLIEDSVEDSEATSEE